MISYTPVKSLYPNGLDDIGVYLGLPRLPNETLADYQRRLLLEARDPSGSTQAKFVRSVGRRVGEFARPIFEVDLVLDGDGVPLAVDPYVEITSSYIRLYDDYENDSIDVELNFFDRTNGYFLRDVWTAIDASTIFTIVALDDSYDFLQSRYLRYGNSDKYVYSELLRSSVENRLQFSNVKEFSPKQLGVFINEVVDVASIVANGDYYIDYYNGIIFSYNIQSGYVSYVYRDFPFRIIYEPVHVWPLNDPDKKEFFKSNLISDTTGAGEKVLLTSTGAEIINDVLNVHPMTWGR
jgi:hypothetical protein